MLSDVDIKGVMATGELIVDPFREDMLRGCGITLHLGESLLLPLAGKTVDVKLGTVPDYESIKITDQSPFTLQPGQFILGHTLEKITVGSTLGFLIEGRSTFARVGLTIVQTAMIVYPGHRNRAVTLELANHGPNPILLYPRMKIARAAILALSSPCEKLYDDAGKYRDQLEVGPPIFKNEF